MNILIVTGTMAKNRVEASSKRAKHHTDVTVLPIPVAALMTPTYIASKLSSDEVKKYDCVLVSGMIEGDMSRVSEQLGVPVLKGPKSYMEISEVTSSLPKLKLSTVTSADEVLQESLRTSSKKILEKVYQRALKIGREQGIRIGKKDLFVGKDLPPRIAASLQVSGSLQTEEIVSEARRLVDDGAEILILSFEKSKDIPKIVEAIRVDSSVPLGVDAGNLSAGVLSSLDVDLLTGISSESLDGSDQLPSSLPIVVRPGDKASTKDDKLRSVEEALSAAQEIGFRSIIASPGMDLPFSGSLVDSLLSHRDFSSRHPEIPLSADIGKIVEHIDADSIGLNCMLSALCVELGMGIMEVSEESYKARGSVREVSTALEMMLVANEMKKTPEKIGIDLFRIKERKRRSEIYGGGMESYYPVNRPEKRGKFDADPKGLFIIHIDERNREIVVRHQTYDLKITEIVRGKEPLDILNYLLKKELVSRLDHAAYLGAELEKARIALDTERTYVQESPLFET